MDATASTGVHFQKYLDRCQLCSLARLVSDASSEKTLLRVEDPVFNEEDHPDLPLAMRPVPVLLDHEGKVCRIMTFRSIIRDGKVQIGVSPCALQAVALRDIAGGHDSETCIGGSLYLDGNSAAGRRHRRGARR